MDTIRVLTSIFSFKESSGSEGSPEWFTSHPDMREEIIQDEADSLIESLLDERGGSIYDSFSDEAVDTSVSAGKVILGIEQPERLIRECENWNESLRANALYWLKKCENQLPEGESFLSWLKTGDFMWMHYSAQMYMFIGALASIGGHLNGTSTRYVRVDGSYNTVMEPEILASVKAHPEYYAIIELAYR